MKKILLTALALFLGVSMYAQEKALTKLSAADAPANVASAGKTVARGATQERAAVELTIYEDAGETQRLAPVYTYYGDTQGSAAQFVVPASQLTDMQGGQITSLKFYINPAQNYLVEEISTPTYAGYMTEVASETMTEFIDFNSATNIFNGNIALTDDCLIIDLATPYTYNGGNLAIAFVCTEPGGFCVIYYYSETVTGGSIYRSNSVNPVNIVNYVPKTTFTYTSGDTPEPECDPITTFPYFNDFEDFLDEKDCWVSIDNDGDGHDWLTGTESWWNQGIGVGYSNALVSESYLNEGYVVLNADNYILTPEINLPADKQITLSWAAAASYQDYYEVLVAPNGSTEVSDFVLLFSDAPMTSLYVTQTADLTNYAGTTVRVVFRNQMSDGFIVTIDNLGITAEGGDDPEPGNFPYLETFDVDGLTAWGNFDEDGDGHLWELAAGYTGQGAKSVSWESSSKGSDAARRDNAAQKENGRGSYDPDNWLISPEITIPSTAGQEGPVQLSWYVKSGSGSFPDHYGVYVSTTGDQPADFTTQVYEGTSPATWTQLTVDLSAYIGQTVRVAFRHYDSYDKWSFTIDDVEVYEYVEPEPVVCDPITTFPYFNDFENFLDEKDCWVSIDNDGDGHDWLTGTETWWGQGLGVDGSHCLVSESYVNATYTSLNADNYLLSPEFELPAGSTVTLSWYEQSQDPSYPDSYEVMIAPNGSTEISDFVSIYSGVAANPWTERTFDLSSYAGQTIRVVFHHQSYDCYMLEIDNMSITLGGSPEPDECAITTFPYFNDFENFVADHDCWISIDADGDGQDWITGTTQSGMFNGYNSSTGLISKSYDYDGVSGVSTDIDADNYLVSPEFVLPANGAVTLSWYAKSTYGPAYPDWYEVMIAPNGSTEISDFVQILAEDGPSDWEQRTVDISAYAGTTVRVVFHHQDFAQYWIMIDNLGVTVGGDDPEPGNFPYLETFDVNGMDDWSNLDEDGDGHLWELAAGYTGQGAKSVSWESSYKGSDAARRDNAAQKENGKAAYDPDNWLISPEITIPSTAGQEGPVQLSWYVKGASSSFPEHYGVYVSTTGDQPADFTTQVYEGISPALWTQLTVDLSAYIGQTVRVAFRHYDSYDNMSFTIDDVEIYEYEEPEPVECDPITTFPYFNDFEDFLTNHDCWIDIDNDGDGQTWITGTTNYWGNGFGVDGSNCILSQSYENATYSAYDADNYLVSPEFELPTTVEESLILSWFEQSQDPSYPDSYEVMIAPNGSTEISDFVSIYSGVAANPWTERTFDLSSYAGQTIRVVFHHQSYDCYMLEIDNMSIYDGQGPEPVTCDPITDFPYFNDFENFPAEKDCWISIDNDGDGHDWLTGTTHLWGNGLGVDESNCLVSESYLYDTGIALDADNYLLSPEFVLPAGENIKLSWFAQAQDPSYPDSYEVMIAPNGSTNVSDFVSVYGEVSTNPWAERYVDISAYAGTTVRVVFHHQDYDNFFVEIDNMGIEVYTGVNEDNDTEFAVYPNPVKNTMTLTGVEVGTEVRIYDLAGNTVMSFVYEGQIVNVENLANGVYVLRANDSMIKIVK